MKTTNQKFPSFVVSLLLAVALSLGVVGNASAINKDELEVKALSAVQMYERTASTFSTIGGRNSLSSLNLLYVGTSTESLVTVTQTVASFYAPFNVLDTGVDGDGTVALDATDRDTMGEFCDYIDSLANYECSLNDARRSDNSSLLLDQTEVSGTNALNAAGGFDIAFDTGGVVATGLGINQISIGITPGAGKRVILRQCLGNINVIGTLNVSGRLAKYENASDGLTRDDSTIVDSFITADDTDLTANFTVNGVGGLMFAKDAHVVVRGTTPLSNDAAVQAAANNVQCWWEEK